MTTISVDFKDLREGDQAVLRGADWEMTGKVFGRSARLYAGNVRISQSIFVSATREIPDTPPLPTEPGAYADKDGDPWLLDGNGYWGDVHGRWRRAADAVQHGPFTRLRPESDVRAEVEVEIARWLRGLGYSGLPGEIERGLYR